VFQEPTSEFPKFFLGISNFQSSEQLRQHLGKY